MSEINSVLITSLNTFALHAFNGVKSLFVI